MEKEPKIGTKFNLVDLIVFSSYYFFCLLLSLSLTGLFKKELIILGFVPGFLFWLWARPKIEWKKQYLYFFIFVPVLFTGILLIKGAFNGDGINYWLPWAREIVLQERMPDFLFNTASWLASRMPLVPLFCGGVFSLFGFQNWAIAILPFFFSAATVFLLCLWFAEKGVSKKYIVLGALILLANPLFLHLGGEAAQEPFILFFFTAFFYYWEKFQRTNNYFYFLLIFLSAILAAVSKESGLILLLPLFYLFIKNKLFKRPYCYLLFLIFPLLLWLARNYLIYSNPFFPFFNEIFKGRYYEIFLTAIRTYQASGQPFWANILARIAEIPVTLFLLFCPLGLLSVYGFFKKRKIQYVLFSSVFLLAVLLLIANLEYLRYFMPFLTLFIVYSIVGLAEASSRIFLSVLFFFNLWGLFFTKLSLSQSQFLAPVEAALSGFKTVAEFLYDYRLASAAALGLFFYFFISQRQPAAKYLIILSAAVFSVKTPSFYLGSWLNVWLPILGLIFVILLWRPAVRFLKEEALLKLVTAGVIALLLFNAWGLSSAYFLTHRNFVFPNFAEAYGVQPEVAGAVERLEGENRDFYICAASGDYFTWYHNFKMVTFREPTFIIITNLEYNDKLNPSEIHSLFKKSNIRYVMENRYYPLLEPFFDKVKSRPDLFEPIFQKEGIYLWRVKI